MNAETTTVTVELGTSDAIVLLDWLTNVDFAALPVDHKAVRQALVDLLAELEISRIAGYSAEELASARSDVTRDMGW